MADESTVIVNFSALESAISSFTTTEGHISELAGRLRSNASAIQSAVISDASNTYVGKVETLAKNFQVAQERLNTEVKNLKALLEKEQQAEVAAQGIADGVSTFTMQ